MVWRDRLVWIGGPGLSVDPKAPVPLILYAPPSLTRAVALETLERRGRAWRLACTSGSLSGLRAAALAGLGVTLHARSLLPDGLVEAPAMLRLPEADEVEFVVTRRRGRARSGIGARRCDSGQCRPTAGGGLGTRQLQVLPEAGPAPAVPESPPKGRRLWRQTRCRALNVVRTEERVMDGSIKPEHAGNGLARSPGALAGLKVIDLTRVLGGPYCTMILSDHGAEVIKIEPPQGDEVRDWGPPFVEHASGERDASYFIGINRNKQSIALDIGKPEGRAVLLRLLEGADVLIENFKPGGMEKWGLGYEKDLSPRFPGLIHCRVSGFGGGRSARRAARLRRDPARHDRADEP